MSTCIGLHVCVCVCVFVVTCVYVLLPGLICDFSEWMPGQPDDWRLHGLGGGEDCAHFHRDGRYNDDHCSRLYRYVCKAHLSATLTPFTD